MGARSVAQSLVLGVVVVLAMVVGGVLAVNITDEASPSGPAATPPTAGATSIPVAAAATETTASSATGTGANAFIEDLPSLVEAVSPSVVRIATSVGDAAFRGEGVGTGVIVDREGHILTNYHVIEGASEVDIELADGTAATATVVGVDPGNDLAIIRASVQPQRLTPATFGDSDAVRIGEPVFAIGNPFGLSFTVTSGIVSGVQRERPALDGRPIRNVIQTDAAVNPGNSGGPLFNDRGEVIGINSSIENPTGQRVFVGIGFAVPSNTALRFMPHMVAGENVLHPQLGISGFSLSELNAAEAGLTISEGVYVTGVAPGSAAAVAGLRGVSSSLPGAISPGGDVITAIDGVPVSDVSELASVIDERDVGDMVTLTVVRGGAALELEATLQAWQGAS